MDIQETGLAFVTNRHESKQMLAELSALFSDHGDWSEYARCPVALPILRTIWEDLQRRFGTLPTHGGMTPDQQYQTPPVHMTGPMQAIREGNPQ